MSSDDEAAIEVGVRVPVFVGDWASGSRKSGVSRRAGRLFRSGVDVEWSPHCTYLPVQVGDLGDCLVNR